MFNHTKYSRTVSRDSGEKVTIVEFPFSHFYIDNNTEQLSMKYDFTSHLGLVASSLGSANTEAFVRDLFRIYKATDCLCGLRKEDLVRFGEQVDSPFELGRLEGELLKSQKIEGVEVLFPTEELMINQRVPKRENYSGE